MEDNHITNLDGLRPLQMLKKLDASHNHLSDLGALLSLVTLTQLSLESNSISSFASLTQLVHLYELYIGNNTVSDLQEIDSLKSLPKLIILDLAGNPVCADESYRLYTLFRIRRLKVPNPTHQPTNPLPHHTATPPRSLPRPRPRPRPRPLPPLLKCDRHHTTTATLQGARRYQRELGRDLQIA